MLLNDLFDSGLELLGHFLIEGAPVVRQLSGIELGLAEILFNKAIEKICILLGYLKRRQHKQLITVI